MSIVSKKLQEGLSQALSSHVTSSLLSNRGKRMFFSTGIIWQTEQSLNAKIKATAGIAFANNKPIMLENTAKMLPNFNAAEAITYAPIAGIPTLRQAWHSRIQKKNPSINKDITTLPIVTSGLTHGISLVLGLTLNPGEELITPDLFWENYNHIVDTSLGGTLRSFPMFTKDTNPKFNASGLHDAIEQSVKKQNKAIILLNFPNNPTGYSITKESVTEIQKTILSFAEKNVPVLILCDDAYFGLFYEDDIYPESVFAAFSSLHKNVLVAKIDGATKELFAWGLRVGFLTFGCKEMPENVKQALETKVKGAIRASVTSSSKISQTIVLRMLEDNSLESLIQKQKLILQQRYNILKKELQRVAPKYPHSGLVPCPVNSGYFMSFRCTAFNSNTLRMHLLQEKSLALISIENDTDSFLRFTFSATDEDIIPHIIETIYKEAEILAKQ